jgi:hypothetical protein
MLRLTPTCGCTARATTATAVATRRASRARPRPCTAWSRTALGWVAVPMAGQPSPSPVRCRWAKNLTVRRGRCPWPGHSVPLHGCTGSAWGRSRQVRRGLCTDGRGPRPGRARSCRCRPGVHTRHHRVRRRAPRPRGCLCAAGRTCRCHSKALHSDRNACVAFHAQACRGVYRILDSSILPFASTFHSGAGLSDSQPGS